MTRRAYPLSHCHPTSLFFPARRNSSQSSPMRAAWTLYEFWLNCANTRLYCADRAVELFLRLLCRAWRAFLVSLADVFFGVSGAALSSLFGCIMEVDDSRGVLGVSSFDPVFSVLTVPLTGILTDASGTGRGPSSKALYELKFQSENHKAGLLDTGGCTPDASNVCGAELTPYCIPCPPRCKVLAIAAK